MMLKGTKGNKKYIGDAMNIEVKKIVLYIYLKSQSLKSMVGRTLGDIRRKNLVYSLMQQGFTKKTSWMPKRSEN